jgi:hypothetical protein
VLNLAADAETLVDDIREVGRLSAVARFENVRGDLGDAESLLMLLQGGDHERFVFESLGLPSFLRGRSRLVVCCI